MPGGDYGFPHNPHGCNAWDAELFVTEFGFTPREVLKAMTYYGGQMMGMSDQLGLVKEGYLADLILVDGDPTLDIRILQDEHRLSLIMQEGKIHKRTAPARIAALVA